MLVSLQQASDHLRRDTTDDDSDLTLKINAASQAVLNYITNTSFLDSSGLPHYDSAGEPLGVPYPIQAAVLLILGDLYADRDGQAYREGISTPRLGEIIIPRAAHFLLDPYRQPVVA